MDALELLVSHRSTSRLVGPASVGEQLRNILRAGIRVPDHKSMQPWHFFVIEEEGRERPSAVLEQEAIAAGSDNKAINKVRNTPLRAPLIITVVVKCEKNHKVPRQGQGISAGCTVTAMQMATAAQGFGDTRRSGTLTEGPIVREAFGCHEQDKTVGLLYLGAPQLKASTSVNVPDPTPFMTYF